MTEQVIRTKLKELPVDLRREVLDYIEFLLNKSNRQPKKTKFKFNWENGLCELKKKYTSVELQHRASDWR